MPLSTESAARKDRTQPTAPSFQHRHYAELARIIREECMGHAIAIKFADNLERTNPRFDRDRFLAACVNGV